MSMVTRHDETTGFHGPRDFETLEVMILGGQTHDLIVIHREITRIVVPPTHRILGFTYGSDMTCQDPRCQTTGFMVLAIVIIDFMVIHTEITRIVMVIVMSHLLKSMDSGLRGGPTSPLMVIRTTRVRRGPCDFITTCGTKAPQCGWWSHY